MFSWCLCWALMAANAFPAGAQLKVCTFPRAPEWVPSLVYVLRAFRLLVSDSEPTGSQAANSYLFSLRRVLTLAGTDRCPPTP